MQDWVKDFDWLSLKIGDVFHFANNSCVISGFMLSDTSFTTILREGDSIAGLYFDDDYQQIQLIQDLPNLASLLIFYKGAIELIS